MLNIPLAAVPSQQLAVQLSGQPCKIDVLTRDGALYLNLYVNDALIIGGVIGRDRVRMVRDAYLGFLGDLTWVDTQGIDDPQYEGLGSRWFLLYLEPGE